MERLVPLKYMHLYPTVYPLCHGLVICIHLFLNKNLVISLLSRIPEDSPLEMHGSPAATEESVGLFMLRKDSERRATLHRVLTDYNNLVVLNIQESVPEVSEA